MWIERLYVKAKISNDFHSILLERSCNVLKWKTHHVMCHHAYFLHVRPCWHIINTSSHDENYFKAAETEFDVIQMNDVVVEDIVN